MQNKNDTKLKQQNFEKAQKLYLSGMKKLNQKLENGFKKDESRRFIIKSIEELEAIISEQFNLILASDKLLDIYTVQEVPKRYIRLENLHIDFLIHDVTFKKIIKLTPTHLRKKNKTPIKINNCFISTLYVPSKLTTHIIITHSKFHNVQVLDNNTDSASLSEISLYSCNINNFELQGPNIYCDVIINESILGHASLSKTIIHGILELSYNTIRSLNCVDSTYQKSVIIRDNEFKSSPAFYSASFKDLFIFTSNKLTDYTTHKAWDNYRCLEQIFSDKGMHIEQAEMHAHALEARFNTLNSWDMEKITSYIHRWINNYGRNLWHPLYCWFEMFVLCAFLYGMFNGVSCQSGTTIGWQTYACLSDFKMGLAYSGQLALGPVGLLMREDFLYASNGWVEVLGLTQALLSTIWLYLFISTLRRRFKL